MIGPGHVGRAAGSGARRRPRDQRPAYVSPGLNARE